MAQPVKLNDDLINAARECAASAHRSLAAQVEHWATLGRAIEGSLTSDQSTTLKNVVREPKAPAYRAQPVDVATALVQALLQAVSPESRAAFAAELATSRHPRFGTDPAFPGCVLRYDADGSKIPGHVREGQFHPLAGPVAVKRGRLESAPRLERAKGSRARK